MRIEAHSCGLFRCAIRYEVGSQRKSRRNEWWPAGLTTIADRAAAERSLSVHTKNYVDLQSSTLNPGTRENSGALFVTRAAPRLTAVPAIRISSGPMEEPCLSSSKRILAAAIAAAESKDTCWMCAMPASNSRRRRAGNRDRSVPYSNSYTTIAGIASSPREALWMRSTIAGSPLR